MPKTSLQKLKQIVIIGGGFAGLASAALLAQAGHSVTLLEKNPQLGGRARVYLEKGFTFDMGPSWYLMPEVFERFFAHFGKKPSDFYHLKRLDPHYQVFFGSKPPVSIVSDLEQNRRLFDTFEPKGGRKLGQYLTKAENYYHLAMEKFLYSDYQSLSTYLNPDLFRLTTLFSLIRPFDQYVNHTFTSLHARQVLEYPVVFLGGTPQNTPALYSILNHVDFNQGVFYPMGGFGQVIKALEKIAVGQGVDIRLNTPVTQILAQKGRATGVRTSHKNFPADLIISTADYHHTETRLLDPSFQTYPDSYWSKKTLGPSALLIFLGISKKIPHLKHHNLYFSPQWQDHFTAISTQPSWPKDPSYYVSCTSKSDSSVAPKGQENLFILVPLAAGLQDDQQKRHLLADQIISHLETLIGTQFRNDITVKKLYSLTDFIQDLNAYQGSALGLAHTLFQTALFRPANRSRKLANLFYTGQYTHPGVGVPMTLIASEIIAQKVNRL